MSHFFFVHRYCLRFFANAYDFGPTSSTLHRMHRVDFVTLDYACVCDRFNISLAHRAIHTIAANRLLYMRQIFSCWHSNHHIDSHFSSHFANFLLIFFFRRSILFYFLLTFWSLASDILITYTRTWLNVWMLACDIYVFRWLMPFA